MKAQNLISKWTRYLVIFTLLIGQVIHALRLVMSNDAFHQYVFTASFDSIFVIPMAIAAIGMVLTWRYIRFRNLFEKIAVGFSTFYFISSIPNHLQVWFTKDTSYIDWFPLWFSIVFFCYTIPLIVVWARLQIEEIPIRASASRQIA